MKTLVRLCPVCGGTRGEVLHRQRFAVFDDYPLPSEYDVVVCSGCGMVYADTSATQADYDEFYARCSIYQNPAGSSGSQTPDWDAARLQAAAALIARCVPSDDARILDVGCANGGLLQALAGRGFRNLVGVDPSPVCVEHTRGKGIEAYRGDLTRLPAEIGRSDVVILTAVLEHVLDVKGAISSLAGACRDSGIIFLEVPDAASYAEFLYAPFQDFNTEHINHFSLASLRNLMGQFGFSPVLEERLVVKGPSALDFPCLEAAFKRRAGVSVADQWVVDGAFRESIRRYIEASGVMMKRLDEQLRSLLASSPEVLVWGTGQLAMKLLCDTALREANVAAFIDGNPINVGRRLRGVPILRPEDIPTQEAPIIIATLLHTDDIRAKIARLGLGNPVVALKAS